MNDTTSPNCLSSLPVEPLTAGKSIPEQQLHETGPDHGHRDLHLGSRERGRNRRVLALLGRRHLRPDQPRLLRVSTNSHHLDT